MTKSIFGQAVSAPGADLIMSRYPSETAYPADHHIPDGFVQKVGVIAKDDKVLKVRLAALQALSEFRFQSNTTPILKALLDDNCDTVRIKSSQGLIKIATETRTTVPVEVVRVLMECLSADKTEDCITQATWTLGNLGSQAQNALPALMKLAEQGSPRVRDYAAEAIRNIRKK